MATKLFSHEHTIIVNALRVAAARYTECAAIARAEIIDKGLGNDYERVAKQFDKQADEALNLADKLEL